MFGSPFLQLTLCSCGTIGTTQWSFVCFKVDSGTQAPDMFLKWLLCLGMLVLATEPAWAQDSPDSIKRSLPDSVLNGETYLYTDISLVNATDSLDRIMKLDLVKYTFLHDSVGGRKLTGVLPRGEGTEHVCRTGCM